jgi:hypothetical protein
MLICVAQHFGEGGGLTPFKQNDYYVQPVLILRAAFYRSV